MKFITILVLRFSLKKNFFFFFLSVTVAIVKESFLLLSTTVLPGVSGIRSLRCNRICVVSTYIL